MNISERATILAVEKTKAELAERVMDIAARLAMTPCDELVSGEDVCWLVAHHMASRVINGGRVHVRVMDDGVQIGDALG